MKRALATRGLIEEEFRLPLVPVQPKTAEIVDRELAALGDELAPAVAGQGSEGR